MPCDSASRPVSPFQSFCPPRNVFFAAAVAVLLGHRLKRQSSPNGYQQAVGGISIKSDGLIENAGVDTLGKLRAERARLIRRPRPTSMPPLRSARSRSADWKKPSKSR